MPGASRGQGLKAGAPPSEESRDLTHARMKLSSQAALTADRATTTRLRLDEVLAEPVDWRFRSFPIVEPAPTIGEVGAMGWNARDGGFSPPVLVLRESALDHNVALMANYCRRHGVSLAPHAKTPVAPQIVERQLAAGAWGVTVPNLHEGHLFRRLGVQRILIANEVVDDATLRWIAGELDRDADVEILSLVDSEVAVKLMDERLDAAGSSRRLRVLVELGFPGGRCGCRTNVEALAVADRVRASRHLEVAGVEAFEGMVAPGPIEQRLEAVDALIGRMRSLMVALDGRGLFEPGRERIVTAGGSLFFDRVVEGLKGSWQLAAPPHVIVRSGVYVTHDGGEYEEFSPLAGRAGYGPRLRQALELWAHVVSRPEPELVILGFGKRDASYDHELPRPFAVRTAVGERQVDRSDLEVFLLHDQHARVHVRRDLELEPGDLVGLHISHPCTTFDKWRLVPLVDDGYRVTGAVRSYL